MAQYLIPGFGWFDEGDVSGEFLIPGQGWVNVPSPPASPAGVAITQRRVRLAEEAGDDEIWRAIRGTSAPGAPPVPPADIVSLPPRGFRLDDTDEDFRRRPPSVAAPGNIPSYRRIAWRLDDSAEEDYRWRPRALIPSGAASNLIVTKFGGDVVLNASIGEAAVAVTKFGGDVVLNASIGEAAVAVTKFAADAVLMPARVVRPQVLIIAG